jgi:hypothetical protein
MNQEYPIQVSYAPPQVRHHINQFLKCGFPHAFPESDEKLTDVTGW